jgi:hypothetical protein
MMIVLISDNVYCLAASNGPTQAPVECVLLQLTLNLSVNQSDSYHLALSLYGDDRGTRKELSDTFLSGPTASKAGYQSADKATGLLSGEMGCPSILERNLSALLKGTYTQDQMESETLGSIDVYFSGSGI